MAKVLITGGAGFVGSNLAKALLNIGHEVIIIDNFSSGHMSLVDKRSKIISGSINDDSKLKDCFSHKPDFVFHLAALFANQNSVDHPSRDLEVNGMGMIKVLEYSQKTKVKKFVYTSSSCVYGNGELMSEKDKIFAPDTPYAITKLLGEQYCEFWSRHHGLNVNIVRLFNTYGPGEFPGQYRNVIPNFIKLAAQGKPLPITGTGNETRDFTFIDDTVQGLCAILESEIKNGEIFNIATGEQTTIQLIATLINNYMKNNAGIEYFPRRNWDHVTQRCASVTKAREILDFHSKVSIEDGIEATCEWIINNECN